jgi:hypothetical protein
MFLRRIPVLIFLCLILQLLATTAGAQNMNWLQGSWEGRAFVTSNDPAKNFTLLLTIGKLKGKNFEGSLQTIKPTDTVISKVTGVANDNYILINIISWKVECGNCKPQNLAFSIENGDFYFKGEAKGCSDECTWVTVFSRKLSQFDVAIKQTLYNLANFTPMDTTTVAVVETPVIEPEKKAIVEAPPAPPVIIEKKPVAAPVITEVRIPMLSPGQPVLKGFDAKLLAIKKPGALTKKPGLQVPQNAAQIRIPLIAADGPVVSGKDASALLARQSKSIAYRQANSIAMVGMQAIRIPLQTAEGPVLHGLDKSLLLAKQSKSLLQKRAGLLPVIGISPIRIPVLATGDLVSLKKPTPSLLPALPPKQLTKNKGLTIIVPPPAAIPVVVVTKTEDPAIPALPKDYNDRKINVVRTLNVNTDSVVLNVYDNGIVDGDIVSVIYNDKIIVDKLSLKSKALVITIAVNKRGSNKLVFYAHNLGEFPPNTAKLDILYGSKKEELTLSSDFTVSSAIDIVYQP